MIGRTIGMPLTEEQRLRHQVQELEKRVAELEQMIREFLEKSKKETGEL
jgi:hypothetical protein